jgi:uncharacterized protein (DUF169 family)
MEQEFKQLFIDHWKEYFDGAELPITFQYSNNGIQAEPALSSVREKCILQMLNHVRDGTAMRFFARSFGCGGGKYYAGFATAPRADIAAFLSCGFENERRGERYRKDPETAAAAIGTTPWYEAPAAHLVFKRWDKLDEHDEPEVVIFFAPPDVLSGLVVLAGFDEPKMYDIAIMPHGSGCASIIQYPYNEKLKGTHRAVVGMFDITARPFVSHDTLTFAVTMERFQRMVYNMPQSFLIAPVWQQIRKRIKLRA